MNSKTGLTEIARRALACLLIAAALVTFLTPAQALLRVAPEDFAEMQKTEVLASQRQMPLADYVAQKTKDRLVSVQGSEWQNFFQAVKATTSGQPPNSTWGERRDQWLFGRSVFFGLDEAPLNQVTSDMSESIRKFRFVSKYVMLADSAPPQYLNVSCHLGNNVLDDAPPHLIYPWRSFSLWLALLALAVYALLPSVKHPAEALRYPLIRAVLLYDLLGFLLFGVCFAFPLFFIQRMDSEASLFGRGYILLTLLAWLISLSGSVLLAKAAWYAVYELLVQADRLRVTDLFRQSEHLYRDMASVDPIITRWPAWVIIGGLIIGLFFWPALLASLRQILRPGHAIEVARKEGKPFRIQTDMLLGSEKLMGVFRQQGVPLA